MGIYIMSDMERKMHSHVHSWVNKHIGTVGSVQHTLGKRWVNTAGSLAGDQHTTQYLGNPGSKHRLIIA